MPNLKHCIGIDKLQKIVNALQAGTGKNPTTVLYSETTKPEHFSMKQGLKKKQKWQNKHKNYARTYNAEILNSFNPELYSKNIEFTIKNKLKSLVNELRCFKFVIILVI